MKLLVFFLFVVASVSQTFVIQNFDVRTYGARGNGLTDDTAAIQAAITAAQNVGGGAVFFPTGTYKTTASISITGSSVKISCSPGAVINPYFDTAIAAFNFSGTVGAVQANNSIDGCNITSTFATKLYRIGVKVYQQNSFRARDITINYANVGFWLDGNVLTNPISTYRVIIEGSQASYINDSGIRVVNAADVFVDHWAGGGGEAGSAGILLINAAGIWITNSDVLSHYNGLRIEPNSGSSVAHVWVIGTAFDGNTDYGIKIVPDSGGQVNGVHFTDSWSSTNLAGVVLGGAGTIQGVRFYSHRSLNNLRDGFVLNNGVDVDFVDCTAAGNSVSSSAGYHGLVVAAGMSHWRVQGGTYGYTDIMPLNQQGWGIVVMGGASDHYVIQNAVLVPNISGSLSDGGSGTDKIIKDNLGYNPVGISSITVTASPFTYTAGGTPVVVLVETTTATTSITRGGKVVCTTAPCSITLPPNGAIVATYNSTAPVLWADIQ